VVVVEGEFEVRWLVVGPQVVIGRARDDLGVDVLGCDSRFRQCEVVWVVVQKGSVGGELANEVSEVVVVKVLGVTGNHRRCESIVRVLLESDSGAGREGIGVMVKLFNEERPPFVQRSDSVMSWLDFGDVGGSDEVEKEVRKKNWCFGPLSDVEKSKRKWCDVIIEFFAVSNGGDCLLEVWLVIDGLRFGG
jgi:hypothetical protein